MMFKDNAEYVSAYYSEIHQKHVYLPVDSVNGYHLSRYVAAGAQDIFSQSGATKEFIRHIAEAIKEICNNERDRNSLRTDIGTLMDNLLYRLQYPVDELCAVRMGAIYCFIDGENPDNCQDLWTQQKVTLAVGDTERKIQGDPDLYSFFLTLGVQSTPSYMESCELLINMEYIMNRRQILEGLTPLRLHKK